MTDLDAFIVLSPIACQPLDGPTAEPLSGQLADPALFSKVTRYDRAMSVMEVVDDLIALQRLADREADTSSRRALEVVRRHLAERERGAKVAEAATLLGVSVPTVRSWVDAGVLSAVTGARPLRVEVRSLALVKQLVDELRSHGDDRQLLGEVARLLRDRAVLAGDDVTSAFEEARSGRLRPLDQEALDELLPPKRVTRSKSA
jgi:hypothetical protein